jgi:hypothetical protein
MIDPTPLPGLAERTVVVIGAESDFGVATVMTLLASGATVVAADRGATLPISLVDAGTGLAGILHYRSLEAGWPAVCDWIGEHAAGVHGIADHAGDAEGVAALTPHLLDGATLVHVGETAAAGDPELRTNAVRVATDSDPIAVGAAAAFLLSQHAAQLSGSVLVCASAPPDQI